MTQAKIFLTGATGNVGTELVKELAALNIPFKALVRNPDNAGFLKSLPQAQIVVGDIGDKAFLSAQLKGIEKAFLLTNSSEDAESLQLRFVETAYETGIKHIVKLSQLAANEESPVRFLRYHAKVENRIKELGLTYTFLRPNLYMQGILAFKDFIKNEGVFYAAIGNAPVSIVNVRDIAAVAAKALTEKGHENKIYDITGGAAITHYEIAEIFSKVLGRLITFIDVTPEQMEGAVRAAGFPEWQVGGLLEDYAHYTRGEAAAVSNAVSTVTKRSPITLEQFITEHKDLF